MTTTVVSLRLVGLLGVLAALLDPGCARPSRPILDVALVGDLPDAERERELARLADAAPWADVVDGRTAAYDAARTDVGRVVAGDPGPVLEALRERPAVLAWQVAGPALVVTSVRTPARIVVGTRTDIRVTVGGLPAGKGQVRVDVSDAVTGFSQGRVDKATEGREAGATTSVVVPWLATRQGRQTLRVRAAFEGQAPVRPSAPGDVAVDVRPADVAVSVIEARPTWAARFARLALAGVSGIGVRSEVRVAPGLAVRTSPSTVAGPAADADAAVILVGGVEALTSADVTRLERDVRERGRAVILLLDEAPRAGPWRRLWPDATGAVRTAPTPVSGLVAGHVWNVREWLQPPVSTAVVPLAYLDSNAHPIVFGRAVGHGRVVLVTALDAWRWRAEPQVAFDAGWRALVQRLGADVPPPLATTVWGRGAGRARTLELEVALRSDVVADRSVTVEAVVGEPGWSLPLWQVGDGRRRGALRMPGAAPVLLRIEVRSGGQVVAQERLVADVSAPRVAASWEDVARHQADRGRLAAGRTDEALTRLREMLAAPTGDRWHVTRTWWWAGLLLAVLGAEWLLRRWRGAR